MIRPNCKVSKSKTNIKLTNTSLYILCYYSAMNGANLTRGTYKHYYITSVVFYSSAINSANLTRGTSGAHIN